MEQLAAIPGAPVDAVEEDRRRDCGEMDANLVGAAGLGTNQQERVMAVVAELFVFGAGIPAVARDGHLRAVAGVARRWRHR